MLRLDFRLGLPKKKKKKTELIYFTAFGNFIQEDLNYGRGIMFEEREPFAVNILWGALLSLF